MNIAWPHEAYLPYLKIKSRQGIICEMVSVCLKEGGRSKDIFVSLVPIIGERAEEISTYANDIIDMLPDRVAGRYPKWFRIAEQVEELASNIASITQEIKGGLRTNDMAFVEGALKEIRRQGKEIEKTLKQIPRPVKPADLSVWAEVADMVNEGLKD